MKARPWPTGALRCRPPTGKVPSPVAKSLGENTAFPAWYPGRSRCRSPLPRRRDRFLAVPTWPMPPRPEGPPHRRPRKSCPPTRSATARRLTFRPVRTRTTLRSKNRPTNGLFLARLCLLPHQLVEERHHDAAIDAFQERIRFDELEGLV